MSTSIDITRFVMDHSDCMDAFSSSVARSGLENIGEVTWRNALNVTEGGALLTEDADALVDYFAGFGAWERSELEAMSLNELNAMLVQDIAAVYQERDDAAERGELESWEENFGGRLVVADNGAWSFYIGE